MFFYKQIYQIHELADIIENEYCEDAGWKKDALIDSINAAKPQNRQSEGTEGARMQQDVARETGIGASYQEGVKVVEVYHSFVKEPNGKVSHWIHDKRNSKLLFKRLDQFNCMTECIVVFTLETGNGKIHSSKGVGRLVYNTAIGAEQSRNLVADNLYLSGMLLLKSTVKGKAVANLTVHHPVCVIPADFEVIKDGFQVNVDSFFALDRFFTNVAEVQVGAYLSQGDLNQKGEKATATQIEYISSIEQQLKQTTYTKFWLQYAKLVSFLQKRIFSPENIAQAHELFGKEQMAQKRFMRNSAKEVLMRLDLSAQFIESWDDSVSNADEIELINSLFYDGLDPVDVYLFGICPANEAFEDPTQTNLEKMNMITAKYQGNPAIRQTRLMQMDIAAIAGNKVAQELVIPEEDNTITSEAIRLQTMEMPQILAGEQVPVSPRDAHLVHLQVIAEKISPFVQQLRPDMMNEQALTIIGSVHAHADAHLQAEIAKGTSKTDPNLQMFVQMVNDLWNFLQKSQSEVQKSAAQQIQGKGMPTALPPKPSLAQMEMADGAMDLSVPDNVQNAAQNNVAKPFLM
jgi:hypothetical protein